MSPGLALAVLVGCCLIVGWFYVSGFLAIRRMTQAGEREAARRAVRIMLIITAVWTATGVTTFLVLRDDKPEPPCATAPPSYYRTPCPHGPQP